MNQILYEENQTSKTDINKIKIFFAIVLIIFGVSLAGGGTWGLVTKFNSGQKLIVGTKPQVETNIFEDDQILIKVTHDKAIEKILYSWNDEADNIILGRGRSSLEELIEMPVGENLLNIRVIDIAGEETSHIQTYSLSSGVDIQKPTIELSVVGSNIKIIAQDETEISYITYRWNNEEEQTVNTTDLTGMKIEVTVPIIRGENSLTVIAVDANNNTETKIEKFNAVSRPTIKVTQYANKLTITIEDEQGLEKVEYNLNGQNYRWTKREDDSSEWTYWTCEIEIPEGDSKIIINAWNKAGAQANEFRGRCNYTP